MEWLPPGSHGSQRAFSTPVAAGKPRLRAMAASIRHSVGFYPIFPLAGDRISYFVSLAIWVNRIHPYAISCDTAVSFPTTIPAWLKRRIPSLDWLARYERKHLRGDALAGVIVATLLIPQAMAYALLAGLPPQVGLYASLLPLAVYALLGSSRYLSVGPSALLSLLILTQ